MTEKKVVPIKDIANHIRNGNDVNEDDDAGFDDGDDDAESGNSVGNAASINWPVDLPVVPLGRGDNEFYYLDTGGVFRVLKPAEFTSQNILSLFSPRSWLLVQHFPHYTKKGISGWDTKDATEALMNASANLGQFDPSRRLRGKGAWIADDGSVVYHAGNYVHSNGKRLKPGYIDGYLYPRRDAGLAPGDHRQAGEQAAFITDLLGRWNYERGSEAVELIFGSMVTMLVCAALNFRPGLYLTGNEGTGKTTLLKLFNEFTGHALVMASDATAAGVYQAVRDNGYAVALDETEPDMPLTKQRAMLTLMRTSSSGGLILRGTGEQKSVTFTARSSFVFGSITPLQMTRADLSRIAMIEMRPVKRQPLTYTNQELRAAGSAILARVLRYWPDFQERIAMWKAALLQVGHDPRGADAYGTLLAASDFAQHERPLPQPELLELAKAYAVSSVDEDGNEQNGEKCLHHLFAHAVQPDGEARRWQIWTMIERLCVDDEVSDEPPWAEKFDKTLRQTGIAVMAVATDHQGNTMPPVPIRRAARSVRIAHYIAVANKHTGLARAFIETPWQTAPGSAQSGWVAVLRRLDDDQYRAKPGPRERFSGAQQRTTLLQIDHLLEGAE